jgi:thymidine phosphorylase
VRASLAVAPVVRPVFASRAGVVTSVDCRAIGLVVTGLGGNRRREDDAVDPAVGLSEIAPVGAPVDSREAFLAVVHARSESSWEEAARALRAAVSVGDSAPPARPVVG